MSAVCYSMSMYSELGLLGLVMLTLVSVAEPFKLRLHMHKHVSLAPALVSLHALCYYSFSWVVALQLHSGYCTLSTFMLRIRSICDIKRTPKPQGYNGLKLGPGEKPLPM